MLAFRPVTSLVGITSTFFERNTMPCGLDRSGDFRNGTPVTKPHDFGNDVTWQVPNPEHFGNPINEPVNFGNPVTWQPTPSHFGNVITPATTLLATPVATPTGGSYTGAQSVTLTTDPNATATYYTTDGSTPTTGSTLYTGAITTVGSGTEVIKAFSRGTGAYSDSAIMTDIYVITAAGPMLIAHAAAGGVGYPPSSTTAAIDTRLANFIVIAAGVDTYTAADNTISDSEHNIWTHIPGTTNIGNGSPEFYYCVNPNVSSTHTFTNTTTQYCTSIAVQAWSGISLTPFSGSYIDSNGVSQPPAPLTPNIGDLVVFAVGGNSSVTVANITVLPSGFTVTDALDPVSFSENHTSMGYAIFDGTSATTVLLYDPTVTYGEGTVVNDGAGNYYIALYGNNVGHALVGSGWWAPFAPGSYCQPVFAGTTGNPSEILASFAHA
jgi:hypothetical protein